MIIDWGTAPAWAAVCVGAIAAKVALRQMRNNVQIARANMLLALDSAYEKPEFYRARKAVRSLRNRAEAEVRKNPPKKASADGIKDAICLECSHQLDQIWSNVKLFNDLDVEAENSQTRIDSDRYSELMSLPYWFETIGMLCRRELLPLDDVLNLYDQVIITTMTSFANHIDARSQELPYNNRRFLENAIWLQGKATDYKARRDDPKPDRPFISRIRWVR